MTMNSSPQAGNRASHPHHPSQQRGTACLLDAPVALEISEEPEKGGSYKHTKQFCALIRNDTFPRKAGEREAQFLVLAGR